MSVKIILADDHKIVRDGLRSLLDVQPDMEVIGQCDNGRTVVKLATKLKPDAIIMDVGMPDLNGVEATRQVLAKLPGVKVIALSMHSDKRFVAGMLSAGAAGFLIKDCAFEELADAIRTVIAGKPYLSPGIVGVVVGDYVHHLSGKGDEKTMLLTAREREVLQLIAEGKPTREIAAHLNVSIKTVETHRRQIMEKLDLHSVAELTKYAIREGLTTL